MYAIRSYYAADRPFAPLLIDTVTVADAPAARLPDDGLESDT